MAHAVKVANALDTKVREEPKYGDGWIATTQSGDEEGDDGGGGSGGDDGDDDSDRVVTLTAKQYLWCGHCGKALSINGLGGPKLTEGASKSPMKEVDIVIHPQTSTVCHAGCFASYQQRLKVAAQSIVSRSGLKHLERGHVQTLMRQAQQLYVDAPKLGSARFIFFRFSNPALPYGIRFSSSSAFKAPHKHSPTKAPAITDTFVDPTSKNPWRIPQEWWSTGHFAYSVDWNSSVMSREDVLSVLLPLLRDHQKLWSSSKSMASSAVKESPSSSSSPNEKSNETKRQDDEFTVSPFLVETDSTRPTTAAAVSGAAASKNHKHMYILVTVVARTISDMQRYAPSVQSVSTIHSNAWHNVMSPIASRLLLAVRAACGEKLVTSAGQTIILSQNAFKSVCEMYSNFLGVGIQLAGPHGGESLWCFRRPRNSPDKEEAGSEWSPHRSTEFFVTHQPASVGYPYFIEQTMTLDCIADFERCNVIGCSALAL